MEDPHTLMFESFRLDRRDERLWHGEEAIRLTNKTFAVLCYLVEHRSQLVTKDALLEAVWSRTYVTEAALAMCIRELRQALGDDAKAPRFIETVRGRGYRFIPPVTPVDRSPTARAAGLHQHPTPSFSFVSPQFPAPGPTDLVGREAELTQLHEWLVTTLRGKRQVGFISGENGIGKTKLVDAFVARAATEADPWIGHGQCIDQYGAGEAYLPVLEALGRLCRGAEGEYFIALLRQHAPSWLVHMPALLSTDEREALQRTAGGATRDRMLRELAEAAEILTAERPLVLVLEDLHWSDTSTFEWLAYVARRRDPARLLVVGTYRPVEAIVREHPVRTIVQDLKRHDQCGELVLDYLSEAEVAAYLAQRSGGKPMPNGLARVIHERTNGNPLFMVTLVDTLMSQGALWKNAVRWHLAGGLEAVAAEVPESLRQLIEQQLGQVSVEVQEVLEAASVAGTQFSAAAVAAGTERDVEAVETQLTTLTRQGQFVQPLAMATWPDGTVAGRYGFVHALYQEVLYDRVPARRRVRLHRQIGACLEAGHGGQAQEIAAELATHFVRGSDASRAVQYLVLAGENALRRSAHQQAITHLTQGLEILTTLPDTRERAEHELTLQYGLGGALIAAKGYAWPQTGQTFSRARELCRQLAKTAQVSTVLYGLCLFHLDRGEMNVAREVAEEALQTAKHENDTTALLLGHRLVGTCFYFLGRLVSAREHLEQALGLYDPVQHRSLMFVYGTDVRVAILSWLSRVLFLLGYPELALTRSHEAVALARELSHPHSLAFALRDACFPPEFCRDTAVVRERANAVMSLASEQGFSYELEEGRIHHGWALAETGRIEEGIAEMRQGLGSYRATGSEFQIPYFLALLANVYGKVGQREEGLSLLNEALDRVERTQERWFEAELYRLKGNLLLVRPTGEHAEAEACYQRASEVAQGQSARLFELRAATSLSRLWCDQGKRNEAHDLVAPIYDWFTGGFDTADLKDARTLLDELT
ncbi:MAG: winged helix-turn-helix domain-containing protein [Acidiferrobacterales bacterium]